MTPNHLYRRYQELQTYVGWTDADARRVAAAGPLLTAHFDALIEDFYAEIARHPAALAVITGGQAQIERLKKTLRIWLEDLLSGRYNADYVARRWGVGRRHIAIGLDQVYTNVALSRIRTGLIEALQCCPEFASLGGLAPLQETMSSLNKLLDLDLAIIEDAYQAAHIALINERNREKQLQSERLAAIGQMVAGLAHESANALARSQVCLETLTLEIEGRPEAQVLISRIQLALEHLRQLYEDFRGYAAPIKLELEDWDLAVIWRQAWQNLALQRQGRAAELIEHVDARCRGHVDQFRLEQVFRNIFDNALAACKDPVAIEIHSSEIRRDEGLLLRIAIRDNGPGLNPEQRQRIFEPFFTTKTKGTGLGMAIAKRIVEAHRGEIAVANVSGGAEIVITLPGG